MYFAIITYFYIL